MALSIKIATKYLNEPAYYSFTFLTRPNYECLQEYNNSNDIAVYYQQIYVITLCIQPSERITCSK